MSLTLRFRKKLPDMMAEVRNKSFGREKSIDAKANDGIRVEMYKFSTGESSSGVRVTYHDGLYKDDAELYADPELREGIEALASITFADSKKEPNEEDRKRMMEIGKFLRDHYQAILYDDDKQRIIKD